MLQDYNDNEFLKIAVDTEVRVCASVCPCVSITFLTLVCKIFPILGRYFTEIIVYNDKKVIVVQLC